jgi:predicted DNA-binding transcriptional regulator YafY
MGLHRLIAILLLMESRGRIKAKDLAAALETSVRTIYRDIDILAEAGIPIATETGPYGGIHLMEGYTVNLKQLRGDDVIHLYLTGMGIHSDGHSESGLKLKNALLKLEKSLPEAYQTDIRKAKARFYFDETPWWTKRTPIACLETLRPAVWHSRKAVIQYRKTNGQRSARIVHPYGLVVKMTDWYLVAFCERAEAIRTLKCERIEQAELLNEEFAIPPDFSLEAHWKTQHEEFISVRKEQEHCPVLLKVRKDKTGILNKLDLLYFKEEQDHVLTAVNMHRYDCARSEVGWLIGQAEILEPQALREYAREEIRQLHMMYQAE